MKTLAKLLAAAAAAASVFACAPKAEAANYIVYLYGRTNTSWTGSMYSFSGWTNVVINYNSTTDRLAQANAQVTPQLAQYCSNGNTCWAIAYSNGTHQLAYTQANYPSALTGLVGVVTGGAAKGGTDLLNGATSAIGSIIGEVYNPGVDTDLFVSTARNDYNHNLNNGVSTYMVAGTINPGNWEYYTTNLILPGSNDGVVPYHSSLGCVNSGSQGEGCAKWAGHSNKCLTDNSDGVSDFAGYFGWKVWDDTSGVDHIGCPKQHRNGVALKMAIEFVGSRP